MHCNSRSRNCKLLALIVITLKLHNDCSARIRKFIFIRHGGTVEGNQWPNLQSRNGEKVGFIFNTPLVTHASNMLSAHINNTDKSYKIYSLHINYLVGCFKISLIAFGSLKQNGSSSLEYLVFLTLCNTSGPPAPTEDN